MTVFSLYIESTFSLYGTMAKLSEVLRERANVIAAKAAKQRGLTAILFILAAVLIYHFSSACGASTAVLYLFANNGKVSGRMGGDVKMRNGRGRGFTVPALVRNIYTLQARANLGGFSSAFRGLTATQIAGWNAATGFTYIDRFAQTHVLKGKALYVRLNTNLTNVGATTIDDAPVALGVTPLIWDAPGLVAAVGASNFELHFTETSPIPTGFAAIFYATGALGAGISRPSQSAFRKFQTLPAGATSPNNQFTAYTAKFGGLIAGSKIFVQARLINTTTGEASAISETVAIVAP